MASERKEAPRVRDAIPARLQERFVTLIREWRVEKNDIETDYDSSLAYGKCADDLEALLGDFDV